MQQWLAVPLTVGMEDVGEGERDLSVHCCLCKRHEKQDSDTERGSIHKMSQFILADFFFFE